MQPTDEEIQDDLIGSANVAEEGSNSMTIEYLRARLHSERSVTKATRDKADELSKRVAELEEQLKIVTVQRKRAERATLDVLALLENHGMGEVSDEYDSDSSLEESHYEPNLDKGNSVAGEEHPFISKQKIGSSGSEHESIPSTGRSLSWKSSKDSPRSCERKCFDPSPRRRSSFVQFTSSSKHRLGKSCRQIKRKEVRSFVEESRHESRSPDVNGSGIVDRPLHINGLDSRSEELRNFSENNDEKALLTAQMLVSSEAEGQVSGASVFDQNHSYDGEMERALQHQAHLIGHYAAEEQAQREWEEKYMGNGYSLPDSCEPGNQSDVTEERNAPEERGEAQASAPCPTRTVASDSDSHKSKKESIICGKGSLVTHVDSCQFPQNDATESSHNLKINEGHSCRASASDFAFPVVSETHVFRDNCVTNPPPRNSLSQAQFHSPCSHMVSLTNGGSNYCQADRSSCAKSKEYAIIPHEGPQRLGGVLDALQQAKQFLGRNISGIPPKEVKCIGIEVESSLSSMRDSERMKMDVGSAGLFRVPTDFQFESSGPQTTIPGVSHPSRLNDYCYNASVTQSGVKPGSFFVSMPASPESGVSSSKPWYDTSLPSSSGFTPYSPNSVYPDRNQWMSGSESSFTVQSPSRTPGLPPIGHPFLYSDHIRPGMYR